MRVTDTLREFVIRDGKRSEKVGDREKHRERDSEGNKDRVRQRERGRRR
jgi:hypothetical protein